MGDLGCCAGGRCRSFRTVRIVRATGVTMRSLTILWLYKLGGIPGFRLVACLSLREGLEPREAFLLTSCERGVTIGGSTAPAREQQRAVVVAVGEEGSRLPNSLVAKSMIPGQLSADSMTGQQIFIPTLIKRCDSSTFGTCRLFHPWALTLSYQKN